MDQKTAIEAEVRLYDRLFTDPTPDSHEDRDFLEFYNEDSLIVNKAAKAEAALKDAKPGDQFQFMRRGYFVVDEESSEDQLIFNRTVTLKDSWKKKQSK